MYILAEKYIMLAPPVYSSLPKKFLVPKSCIWFKIIHTSRYVVLFRSYLIINGRYFR